eukprot:scaffold38_cov415-Prasinococcus_capsulatus_cf.AAC.11
MRVNGAVSDRKGMEVTDGDSLELGAVVHRGEEQTTSCEHPRSDSRKQLLSALLQYVQQQRVRQLMHLED